MNVGFENVIYGGIPNATFYDRIERVVACSFVGARSSNELNIFRVARRAFLERFNGDKEFSRLRETSVEDTG